MNGQRFGRGGPPLIQRGLRSQPLRHGRSDQLVLSAPPNEPADAIESLLDLPPGLPGVPNVREVVSPRFLWGLCRLVSLDQPFRKEAIVSPPTGLGAVGTDLVVTTKPGHKTS